MVGVGQLIVDSIRGCLTRADRVFGRVRFPAVRYPGLVGSCLVLAVMLLGAHVGFSLLDEAHLWYGAQRVAAGEIPLRDFQGYDPGRYYWIAAVMVLLRSHGMIAMQVAVALFAAIGAAIANWLVFRKQPRPGLWLFMMVTLTLLVWMFVRHKLFDVTSSVVLVALLTWLIEQPTQRRCFVTGLGLGAIAMIGRNHGLYGALADVMGITCVALVERRTRLLPALAAWCAGMLLGYSPMILAAVFVPGFWTWLWASIHVYFEVGATNNNVPVPWPWLLPGADKGLDAARFLLAGSLLIVQLLFGLTVAGYSVWRSVTKKVPLDPLVFASALLAIPYTHHAFARAGLRHLAQAAFPMLICTFALVAAMPRPRALVLATLICVTSTFLLLPEQPLYMQWVHRKNWMNATVGSDMLFIPPGVAFQIAVLTALVDRYAPGDREFVAAPFLPGAYALFDRRAAVWDPYSFFPADTQVQEAEIARIQAERPGFVLIEERTLDDDPSLTYSHSNPLVYDFIKQHFVRVNDPAIPAEFRWELYVPVAATGQLKP